MRNNYKVRFSSESVKWATPKALYDQLNAEFHFNDDPCPINPLEDGLALVREWGTRTYVNPPYGRQIPPWVRRSYEESQRGKLVVMLLPARTDTEWFHDYALKANEIRFVRGRLKFGGATFNAPFASIVVVFGSLC